MNDLTTPALCGAALATCQNETEHPGDHWSPLLATAEGPVCPHGLPLWDCDARGSSTDIREPITDAGKAYVKELTRNVNRNRLDPTDRVHWDRAIEERKRVVIAIETEARNG